MPDQLTNQKQSKDYWIKDNALFVCDGWKYGITKEGATVCTGSVPGATQTTPVAEKPVAKIPTNGKLPPDLEKGIMQQEKRGKGRPKKEGAVHRTTKWRREKAEQARLF